MITNRPILVALLATLSDGSAFSQGDDLLAGLEEAPKKEYVYNAFKSSRVIMTHSMELLRPGVLDFRILHRFGKLNQGAKNFYGLDEAWIRLGLDYAVTSNLTVGIGRSKYKQELDGFAKWRPVHQAKGPGALPFSLVLIGGSTLSTAPFADPARKNYFSSRVAWYGQAVIGRKFSDKLTLQLAPTILHRNLTELKSDPHDLYAVALGGRVGLSRRISLTADYVYVANQPRSELHNPFSIGFDIETGGHVFQLHFTNAFGMNERTMLSETPNDWGKGDVQFGFNISRAFQIGGKKKK